MGTLAVMPFLGISLNMISLFGFILVLGILVDDAIVVGESIYGEHSQGRYGTLGAQQGVLVVSKPVIFSTLTTLVAFLPLVFMSGLQGKLARDIPLVVMVALTVSLIESLLILPAHLADVSSPAQRKKGWSSRVYEQFTLGLEWVIERLYQPALEWVLRRGGWCLAIFVSLYLITAGLLSGGWLGMLDDINMESEYIAIQVDYPAGTPLDTIRNEMEQVQGAALRIEKRLEEQTGERYFVGIQITSGVKEIENQSNMIVGLTPNERRHFSTSTVLKHFQKEISALPLQGRVRFKTGYFAEEGKATLQLTGFDLPALKSAAELVKSKLASYAFVYDVTDDLQKGRAEVRLKLKPAARDLGLSETALALQVRQAFYGVMAQTLLLDNHETAIFIRLPREQRESLWDLENLPVMLPAGEYVPLVNVANVEYGAAPLYINRIDGKRVITISAMTEYRGNQPAVLVQTIVKTLRPLVNERFPEIQLEVAGQVKHQQEYKNYLLKSVVLSLLGMYILMAVLFKSYWQPFMVLVAVPFGQIGALLGHAVTGIDVSLWSFVGIVAVSGVVVNDNLVLIDCINRLRQQSYTLMDAIRQATRIRFRPIVLTSVTTFAGLTPLLLERSWQAQFLKPMAVSLAFGVMFATLMTLFLVPVLCVLFDQLLNRFKHRKNAILESLQAEEKGQIALDQAYEQGYSQGVIGQGAESPYQGDVLHAGWEAGWQDGHDVWLSRHPDSEEDGN
jgi:multidrug efflux pump subunit AcrB/ribosome modulation factor